MTKVTEPQNIRLMNIVNIFCQSSGMTAHAKMFLQFWTDSHSNGFGIRLKGLGYLLKKNWHPFEQLGLSVRKKMSSIRTAWAIHLKKKLLIVWASEAICSKINFSQVSTQNNFVASHLCWTICYSPGILEWSCYKVCSQMHHEQSQISAPL